MIKVRLKCFSQVKYALGTGEMTLEIENGTTTSELEEMVRSRADGRLDDVGLSVAINKQYVKDDVVLNDGDEVVLIPPVQGG